MLSRTHKPNPRSRTAYPKPKRVSEDKPMPESSAHLRTQPYARCRSHMPRSSTHTQSYKQACSWKLSEQRKYRESMASSSTIFNNTLRGGGVDEVIYRYECRTDICIFSRFMGGGEVKRGPGPIPQIRLFLLFSPPPPPG